MCLECRELDRVIAHYRELRPQVTDRLTLEGIDLLIAEAEAKRGRYTSKDVLRQVTSLGSDGIALAPALAIACAVVAP